jgi:hypothetical protein
MFGELPGSFIRYVKTLKDEWRAGELRQRGRAAGILDESS